MIDRLSAWVAALPLLTFWPVWLGLWAVPLALVFWIAGVLGLLGAFLTALSLGTVMGMRLMP